MTAIRYQKKPVEIEAVRWLGTAESFVELTTFTQGAFHVITDRNDPSFTGTVHDQLHDSWIKVRTGQYIVKGVRGEFYPVDAKVFHETYQAVSTARPASRLLSAPDARKLKVVQHQVLVLMARGLSYEEVGKALHRSTSSIRNVARTLCYRYGVSDRTHAVVSALLAGELTLDDVLHYTIETKEVAEAASSK